MAPSDEKTQDDTAEIAAEMGILVSAAIVFAKDVALNGLKKLLVSSRHKQSLAGSDVVEPSKSASRVSVRDSSAEHSEQAIVEQNVVGSQEEVQGNGNEVVGVENESTGSANSAEATATNAGASNISTQALDMR